jgi:hypothetical protein
MKRITFPAGVKPNTLENYHRISGAVIFILVSLVLVAPAKAQSSFAGRYSGEWVGSAVLGEEHTGTWTVAITADGGVTGTEYDKTTGQKGELSGFIDGDGYVDLFLKYTEKSYKVKGTLSRRGSRLTGVLKQYSGNMVVFTTDITLTAQNKSTGGISADDPTTQRGVVVRDCLDTILNMKGTLIITMKDGSKRIIDLSEANKITVVP